MKLRRGLLTSAITAITLTFIVICASCENYLYTVDSVINDPGGGTADTILFQTQVQPIFTANCTACHHGSRNPDLRAGNSYSSLASGGYVNLPATTSHLYRQITSSGHSSYTLTAEKQTIFNWIQQGAQNN
jgi:hypothetical protein